MKINISYRDGAYYVDKPNYEGGAVVTMDEHDALVKTLEGIKRLANSRNFGSFNFQLNQIAIQADEALAAAKGEPR